MPTEALQAKMIKCSEIQILDVALRKPQTDNAKFDDLVRSIAARGVGLPILVRPIPGGGYELVDGAQRLGASIAAHLDLIPAHIKEMTDDEASSWQIILNEHRIANKHKDLRDAVRKIMIRNPGMKQKDLATLLSMHATEVSRILQMTKLPERVLKAIDDGEIKVATAYLIATKVPRELQDDDEYIKAAKTNTADAFLDLITESLKEYKKTGKVKTENLRIFKQWKRDETVALLEQNEALLEATDPKKVEKYSRLAGMVEALQMVLSVDPASIARQAEVKRLKEIAKTKKERENLAEKDKELIEKLSKQEKVDA